MRRTVPLVLLALLGSSPPSEGGHFPAGYETVATLKGLVEGNRHRFAIPERRAGCTHMISFTWKGAGKRTPLQNVLLGCGDPVEWTAVLPPTQPMAFQGNRPVDAKVLLPLIPPFDRAEKLCLVFEGTTGKPAEVADVRLLSKTESSEEEGPSRIAIVTGEDIAGHAWHRTGPELRALLEEDDRLEVSWIECPNFLASPLLSHYDGVVLHFKDRNLRPDPSVREGLSRFVASGGGLSLVHFACGAFQDWPEFVRVSGRVWNPELRGHDPHGTFQVNIRDREHPVTAGMEPFETLDELYTCLDGSVGIRVLADAVSKVDKKTYPMAFVLTHSEGRVFHSVLGHDQRAFAAPEVRRLHRRGVLWCVALEEKTE